MSFYLPLGDLIDYVSFEDSIKILGKEMKNNEANSFLHLQLPGIDVHLISRNYLFDNFIGESCPE